MKHRLRRCVRLHRRRGSRPRPAFRASIVTELLSRSILLPISRRDLSRRAISFTPGDATSTSPGGRGCASAGVLRGARENNSIRRTNRVCEKGRRDIRPDRVQSATVRRRRSTSICPLENIATPSRVIGRVHAITRAQARSPLLRSGRVHAYWKRNPAIKSVRDKWEPARVR